VLASSTNALLGVDNTFPPDRAKMTSFIKTFFPCLQRFYLLNYYFGGLSILMSFSWRVRRSVFYNNFCEIRELKVRKNLHDVIRALTLPCRCWGRRFRWKPVWTDSFRRWRRGAWDRPMEWWTRSERRCAKTQINFGSFQSVFIRPTSHTIFFAHNIEIKIHFFIQYFFLVCKENIYFWSIMLFET